MSFGAKRIISDDFQRCATNDHEVFEKRGLMLRISSQRFAQRDGGLHRMPLQQPEAGRLQLRSLGFSMKRADPFSALLNPNASAVVCAGYVLAVSGRLELRLVSHDSHLRMREDHLDV